MASGSVVISRDRVPLLLKTIEDMTKTDVLVGIPGTTADRKLEPGQVHPPINNATLGYIHEFGLPEHNLPARPFLRPGIESAMAAIISRLRTGAKKILGNVTAQAPDPDAGIKALEAVGLTAQNAVRRYINAGVPPPLADSTLERRMAERPNRRGPGLELARRAAGGAPGVDLVKPLVDTGQLRSSITFVLRPRRR